MIYKETSQKNMLSLKTLIGEKGTIMGEKGWRVCPVHCMKVWLARTTAHDVRVYSKTSFFPWMLGL